MVRSIINIDEHLEALIKVEQTHSISLLDLREKITLLLVTLEESSPEAHKLRYLRDEIIHIDQKSKELYEGLSKRRKIVPLRCKAHS